MALRNILNNMPENSNYPNVALIKPLRPYAQSSVSSSSSSSSSSSIQIRTSSPISSSGSSDCSGPVNISPSKFLNAVHLSRKTTATTAKPQEPQMKHYVSIKQLAFDKLRRQQALENDIREQFYSNPNLAVQDSKLRSMGKLKISIYNNVTHLTCHIVESRSLKLQSNPNQPTYVKLSILPDIYKSFNNIRTQTIKPKLNPSNNKMSYQYDSKFSFELCQLNDLNTRIVLSVWTQQEQMIGCFSFKLKHVIDLQKPKYIWYHLLPLKYGLNKHLKCSVKKCEPKLTNVNKDLIGMEKLQFNVNKLNETDSYGFTVTSGCPCMIGKVDLDKSAFKSGLRPGDFISRVNGVNVSRASCESVVKMIKSSKTKLSIEVYREKSSDLFGNQVQTYQLRPVASQQVYLESVPEEEDEEDNYDEEDEGDLMFNEEEDDEEEEMRVGGEKYQEEDNYFKVIQNSLRYVDSVSSTEINGNLTSEEYSEPVNNDETEAEKLRRVAVQYYSSAQLHSRQANIRSLKQTNNQFI